jgi:hypothetical protein
VGQLKKRFVYNVFLVAFKNHALNTEETFLNLLTGQPAVALQVSVCVPLAVVQGETSQFRVLWSISPTFYERIFADILEPKSVQT